MKTEHAKKFLGVLMGNWSDSSKIKLADAIKEYRELEKNKIWKGM